MPRQLALDLLCQHPLRAAGPRCRPEGRSLIRERSYNLAGAVTATAGLILLVYTMTQANESGATPLKTAGLFALALTLLACFVLIEQHSKAPLMPLSILRYHPYLAPPSIYSCQTILLCTYQT